MIVALSSFQIYPAVNGGYDTENLEVRWYYNRGFIDSSTVFVQGGNGQSGFYITSTCTVDGSGIITVPSTNLFSTLDAIDPAPQSIQIFGRLYSNNSPKQWITAYSSTPQGWVVQDETPITYEDLVLQNQAIVLANAPAIFPTFAQMIAYIDSLTPTPLASDVVIGRTRLSFAPVDALDPVALAENDPRVGSWFNIIAYGADTANTAAQNTTFVAAARAAAAAVGGGIYWPVGYFPINTISITVPSMMATGGGPQPATGQTVTFTKPITADISKHFDNALSGQGTIVCTNQIVYPDWWATNTTPGTTDMAGAINAADASIVSGADSDFIGQTVAWQGEVWFKPSVTYRINSGLTYRGAPWNLQWATIDYHGSSVAISAVGTNLHRKILDIHSGIIYGGNSTGTAYGLCLSYNMRSYAALSGVIFLGFPGPGVHYSGPQWDLSFYDMQILSCGSVTGSGMDFASQVTATTNANPCVITTDRAHGFASSQSVYLSGYLSTLGTALNGAQTVTVLSATTFSVAVNTTASSVYSGTGASASGVTDINQFNWFNPIFENNGNASSGKGGAIDNTGVFPGAFHQWASFGGLFTSNLGLAEVSFIGGSNINFYAPYVESAGTGDVDNGFYFNNVAEVGCHHPYFTGSANTGAAIQFTNSTVGEVSNIRNTGNWTLSIDVNDFALMTVISLGSLTPAGTDSSQTTRGQINWPFKNNNQLPLWYQPTPNTQTGSVTLTAANLITGIIVGTPPGAGGNVNYQVPSGSLVEASGLYAANDSFDWTIINLGSGTTDTITITAGASHTLVGNAVVQSANAATGAIYGNSGRFRTRKTSTDTWVTYRIS
jgi:hypothetical protein